MEKRSRGRPRIYPPKDPTLPKRPRGRPRTRPIQLSEAELKAKPNREPFESFKDKPFKSDGVHLVTKRLPTGNQMVTTAKPTGNQIGIKKLIGANPLRIKLTRKQGEMLKAIQDSPYNIIAFGGAFSGGKSFGGVSIIVGLAIIYPKSRWAILRKTLAVLKQTSVLTFLDVCEKRGLKEGIHYKFNNTEMKVTFYNGSELFFKGTDSPEDPQMNKLKLELTGCLIEEADETEYRVFTLMRGRVGRRNRLWDAGLGQFITFKPLVMLTFNPSDDWVKREFYEPWKNGTLPANYCFIRALPTDNPYNNEQYLEALRGLPPAEREKYYEGIWEGQAKPNSLVPQIWYEEAMTEVFPAYGERKMGVDVALEGGDLTVFSLWIGNVLVDIDIVDGIEVTDRTDWVGEMQAVTISYAERWKVPHRNITGDGVGNGMVWIAAMRNKGWMVETYKSNYAPTDPEEREKYGNMRNKACWDMRLQFQNGTYKVWKGLKDKVCRTRDRGDIKVWDKFVQQSNAHTYTTDNVKVEIIAKPIVKKILGESPDLFDAVIMGSCINLQNTTVLMKHTRYKKR